MAKRKGIMLVKRSHVKITKYKYTVSNVNPDT